MLGTLKEHVFVTSENVTFLCMRLTDIKKYSAYTYAFISIATLELVITRIFLQVLALQ